jgi:hypothetical protein
MMKTGNFGGDELPPETCQWAAVAYAMRTRRARFDLSSDYSDSALYSNAVVNPSMPKG